MSDCYSQDVIVETSDDEKYNPTGGPRGTWRPSPETIKALLSELSESNSHVLRLNWTPTTKQAASSAAPHNTSIAKYHNPTTPFIQQEVHPTSQAAHVQRPMCTDTSEFDFLTQEDASTEPVVLMKTVQRLSRPTVATIDSVLEDLRKPK